MLCWQCTEKETLCNVAGMTEKWYNSYRGEFGNNKQNGIALTP